MSPTPRANPAAFERRSGQAGKVTSTQADLLAAAAESAANDAEEASLAAAGLSCGCFTGDFARRSQRTGLAGRFVRRSSGLQGK